MSKRKQEVVSAESGARNKNSNSRTACASGPRNSENVSEPKRQRTRKQEAARKEQGAH